MYIYIYICLVICFLSNQSYVFNFLGRGSTSNYIVFSCSDILIRHRSAVEGMRKSLFGREHLVDRRSSPERTGQRWPELGNSWLQIIENDTICLNYCEYCDAIRDFVCKQVAWRFSNLLNEWFTAIHCLMTELLFVIASFKVFHGN